ncbi:GAF and ANTAR domain-containing protein [Nostocoides sp. HKS02]|uniref:GAF and ANTAR domain-containing protein n=1 Tax=Nostocoides sp. HKS02 TaxID=1813880 RepID=UPI0018A7F056|nr:GAF and ANTAR domain-containing protein [Tetrasphaera sp. HKS02]
MSDTAARLRRLVDAEPPLVEDHGLAGRLDRICRAAVRVLPADGAGVTIMDGDARPAGPIAASSPRFRRLEEIQFTLGEGPCVEASAARSPVLEESLATSGGRRWPGYAAAAQEQGVAAVFAFPIQVGAARLGALDLYRNEEGSLSPAAVADALGLASICLNTLLSAQEVATDGDATTVLGDPLRHSAVVFQAQGVVMMQLGVPLAEAMLRLRAHAYSQGRALGEVARDVVAGTLVLARDDL